MADPESPEELSLDPDRYTAWREAGNLLTLRVHDPMDATTAARLFTSFDKLVRRTRPDRLRLDLSEVVHFDDYGALIIDDLRRSLEGNGQKRLDVTAAGERVEQVLGRIDFEPEQGCRLTRKGRSASLLAAIGGTTLSEIGNLRFMLLFLGGLTLSLLQVIRHPRSLRWDDVLYQMEKTGVSALPVVALIGFLLGLIIAFMSAIQFRQFGAEIYVASLVAFGMVSELGPIMTAIVVSGRSGSAYAAEIGAMKINEEVDALVTMGFDPILFLAAPRLIAAVIVIPLLTLFADLFAMAGGLVVGVFMLDLSVGSYIRQSLSILTLTEVLWGTGKSGVFALLITLSGCMRGFQARGGPSAVGSAATSAVVTSIFLIILFDSIFAVIRSYWG
jgi:phospholipid/cholesterol/gamma-HCH transport system permease protein